MAQITIYTTNWCPYCHGAKALLRSKSVAFDEIDVTDEPNATALRHLVETPRDGLQ